MARLKERYEKEIKPQLMDRFGYKSTMQVPKVEKITLNMGVGEAKLNTSLLDAASDQLGVIAGQKPQVRRARKSIANFKLREGMPVGVKVTLRGERMYEMLDRLQSVAIPRIRDFRGLNPRSFDGRGNYSLGIREQIIFPEIDYDSIDQVRGLDVTITTTAETDQEAFELLRMLGMPFRGDGSERRAGVEGNGASGEQPPAAAAEPAEAPVEEPAEAAEQPAADAAAEQAPAEEAPAEEAPAEEAPEQPAAEAEAAGEQEPEANVDESAESGEQPAAEAPEDSKED
jgi:large subunit ribosomal protein L5